MSDAKVETVKKSVGKAIDAWGKQVETIAKQVEELNKQREALEKQLGKAAMDLNVAVLKIDVPEDANEKELAKVPAWVEESVEKKFAPLSKDVEFDAGAEFNEKLKKLIVSMSFSFK
jgi:seryl-tRNA synthetase